MMSNSFPLTFCFKNTMARCAFFPKQYAAAKRANHNKAYLKNSVVKLAGFFKIYRVKICHRAKITITTIKVPNSSNGNFGRSEEHTSELQSRGHLVCRLLLEKKKNIDIR